MSAVRLAAVVGLPAHTAERLQGLGTKVLVRKRLPPFGTRWWNGKLPAWNRNSTAVLCHDLDRLGTLHHRTIAHLLQRDGRIAAVGTDHVEPYAAWSKGVVLRFAHDDGTHPLVLLAVPNPSTTTAHERLALLANVPAIAWGGPRAQDAFNPWDLPAPPYRGPRLAY